MATLTTPNENNKNQVLGASEIKVETAIPAFIGITQKAINGNDSLTGRPWKITSMAEFTTYFGGAPLADFQLSVKEDGQLAVSEPSVLFTFYYQMVMFYANGGGTCYVVSVGDYTKKSSLNKTEVAAALTALEKVEEVTLIVVPEAVFSTDYADILTDILKHCGETMKNRFAILDIPLKNAEGKLIEKPIDNFRKAVGNNYLSYGAAYYPWMNTSVLADNDVNPSTVALWNYSGNTPDLTRALGADSSLLTFFNTTFGSINTMQTALNAAPTNTLLAHELATAKADLHNALLKEWPAYKSALGEIKEKLNLLSPSASMAGIYNTVDKRIGVWKAPGNISVNLATSPSAIILDRDQDDLNMPADGKAVNALRSFPGEGIKVWGARTLDGNSSEWRYINTRRIMLFLEASLKNIVRSYAQQPNNTDIWNDLKQKVEEFLRDLWKRGGLAGAAPKEAFEVRIGLNETMTAEEVQKGILRLTASVALSYPGRFMEITLQQQQPTMDDK